MSPDHLFPSQHTLCTPQSYFQSVSFKFWQGEDRYFAIALPSDELKKTYPARCFQFAPMEYIDFPPINNHTPTAPRPATPAPVSPMADFDCWYRASRNFEQREGPWVNFSLLIFAGGQIGIGSISIGHISKINHYGFLYRGAIYRCERYKIGPPWFMFSFQIKLLTSIWKATYSDHINNI